MMSSLLYLVVHSHIERQKLNNEHENVRRFVQSNAVKLLKFLHNFDYDQDGKAWVQVLECLHGKFKDHEFYTQQGE